MKYARSLRGGSKGEARRGEKASEKRRKKERRLGGEGREKEFIFNMYGICNTEMAGRARRARPKYVAQVQRPASSLNGQGSGSKKSLDGAAGEHRWTDGNEWPALCARKRSGIEAK